MIAKKNPRLDLERKRFVFFQTGLLTVGAFTLAAFAWQSPVIQQNKLTRKSNPTITEIVERIEKEPEKLKIVQFKPAASSSKPISIKIAQEVNEKSVTAALPFTPTVSVVSVSTPFSGSLDNIILPLPTLTSEIIDIPDVEPQYVGGYTAMQQFITDNLEFPQIPLEMGISGKVFVQFVIEKDGSVSGIQIVRGLHEDYEREAKRLIRKMPKWIAGEVKGEKVRTYVRLPFNFEAK